MFSTSANETGMSSHQFLANASHELRTPLNGVIDTLIELLDTGLDDSQRLLAANAWRGSGQLLMLIEELFDLSLLENDTLPMNPTRFDLPALLQSVVNALANTARLHGAELQTHWAVPPLRVYGDPHRLQQLIAAVVRTTLRQHPYGAITLVLSATIGDEGKCQLQVLLNGTRKPLQPDTSSPSWLFATLLARQLQARIDTSADAGAAQVRIELQLPGAPDVLAGQRVLFVAAHDEERAALLTTLRQHGLRADGYSSAGNALIALRQAAATRDPYRVAIFDEQMQAIDGEMLGRAVMSEPTYRDTMLVLRGPLAPGDLPRLAHAGFAAVLATPVSTETLIETLTRLCADSPPLPAKPAPRMHGFSGYRVLVIDDHAVNKQVMARTLASFGCTVDTARDGLEALAMQRAQAYDLALIDCQIAKLDQYVAAVRMLDCERAGYTPIIGCTANLMQAERHDCREAGMDDFICKPLRPFALRRLLEKWLSQRNNRPASTQMPAADGFETVCAMLGRDFDELVTLFIADSPKRIEELRSCLATRNAMQLAKAAHAFSGSTASIGAHGLSALCKALEFDARAGRMAQADKALNAVEQEYARVAVRLEGMLATLRK